MRIDRVRGQGDGRGEHEVGGLRQRPRTDFVFVKYIRCEGASIFRQFESEPYQVISLKGPSRTILHQGNISLCKATP